MLTAVIGLAAAAGFTLALAALQAPVLMAREKNGPVSIVNDILGGSEGLSPGGALRLEMAPEKKPAAKASPKAAAKHVSAGAAATSPVRMQSGTAQENSGFITALLEKRSASVGDLVDSLLLFKKKTLAGRKFDEKVRELRRLGVVTPRMEINCRGRLTKGFASLLYYRAMGIGGGVVTKLVGESARNCHHELVYIGVMPDSSERDGMSGTELVSLMKNANEYRE